MYIEYSELKKVIHESDNKVKNYFDTFGFVVIKNVINKEEFKKFLKEYDHQYQVRANEYSPFLMLLNRLGFSGPKNLDSEKYIMNYLKRLA